MQKIETYSRQSPHPGGPEKTIYAIDQCLSEIKDIREIGVTEKQAQMMAVLEGQLMTARSQMMNDLLKDVDA